MASALAAAGAVSFIPGLVAALDPRVLEPRSDVVGFTSAVTVFASIAASVAGVVGLTIVGTSGGRRTGWVFAWVAVALPFVICFAAIWRGPTTSASRIYGLSARMTCGMSLSHIGKAMLIYANENAGDLPVAGGDGATWGPGLSDWVAENRADVFGLQPDGTGGQATISSSLYLLVRRAGTAPKLFVCRGDRGTSPFDPNDCPAARNGLTAVWDFGPDPARHCSYSYNMPYGPYPMTTLSEPCLAVAADRNPWIDGPYWKATHFSRFKWNGSLEQQRLGNTIAHKLDGQTVLFLDTHVEFIKRAYQRAGYFSTDVPEAEAMGADNIYTRRSGGDIQQGTPPKPYESLPAGPSDSLLVNDPAGPED